MRMTTRFALALAVLASSLASSSAFADDDDGLYSKHDWPLQTIHRPLVLAGSMLEIRGDTLLVNMSKGTAGDPIAIAPDIFFGINSQLTVGVTHQTGFCVAGDLCGKAYNDLGIEALYGLMRAGSFQVAARGGFIMSSLSDPFVSGLEAGLRMRLSVKKIALWFDPSVYLGFTNTDLRDHGLSVPFQSQYQLNTQTMIFLASGINGPFSGFGDAYQIPLGAGANFAVNERLDFGGEFTFGNAFGKGETWDARWLIVRAALRL